MPYTLDSTLDNFVPYGRTYHRTAYKQVLEMGVVYDQMETARARYARMDEGERAEACLQCRECEDECPQSIRISEWMPRIHQVLGEGAPYDPEACAGL